jgi:hypothetical protein
MSGTCVRRPCRVYNLWPQSLVLKSENISFPHAGFDDNQFSLYIQTFLNRPTFSQPAQPLSAELGCSHIRLEKDVGFWTGNVVVGNSEDGSAVTANSSIGNIQQIPRYHGEVDVGIMLSNGQRPGPSTIAIASDVLDVAIPFLATSLGDLFVPLSGVQINEWHGTDQKLHSPQMIRLEAKKRSAVSLQHLAEPFDRFRMLVANMSVEDLRGLAVASRRLSSGFIEDDIIDRYCDFWECCEFLAMPGKIVNGVKLPKAKHAAISKLLCSYVRPGTSGQLILDKKIHESYVVRNDLVHNAVENLQVVDENVRVVHEVALQLFRYRVGMPFEATRELTRLLL